MGRASKPVQNVIDVKDQMTFKVLLANWWSPSSEVGSYTSTKEKRRSGKMKYIWYWEWSYKDREKETELSTKFEEALKKTPEKFPKMGKSCHTGRGKGFRLIEAENEEQLTNLVGLWYPTENFKLVPYFYGSDLMGTVQKWSE